VRRFRHRTTVFVLPALWFALAAVTPAPLAAPQVCTQESLRVEGTTVVAIYCVTGTPRSAGADEQAVPVSETFRTPASSFQRTATLRFVSGETTSRIMDRLDLAPLRLSGVLHLTLAFAAGAVRVEGALLTPGGITIK
jgi:hypothetical protein